jgi:hypothetical protein
MPGVRRGTVPSREPAEEDVVGNDNAGPAGKMPTGCGFVRGGTARAGKYRSPQPPVVHPVDGTGFAL